MGGFKGINEFNAKMRANIDAIDSHFEAKVDEATLEAAVAAQRRMVETIDTTPSALSPGKVGRNWTYAMRNAVDSKVNKRGRRRNVQAGWLKGQRGYFLDQERGTGIVPSGQGMHMLLNGFNEFRRSLDQGMRRFAREKGK